MRQEAVGAVIKTLAGDIDVVGIQNAMHEARREPAGRGRRRAGDHCTEEGCGHLRQGFAGSLGEVMRHTVPGERLHPPGIVMRQQALETADPDMRMRQPHENAGSCRRGFVIPVQRLAGLDQRERLRGVHAKRFEHRGGQHLAHTALEREAAIAAPRPRRLPATLGAEIEQAAAIIAQLGEKEAAPVAKVRVVGAELMPVIAQRQRRVEAARQRPEAPEMREPFGIVQRIQPDAGIPAPVAIAQDCCRKIRRRDDIKKRFAKCVVQGFRSIGGGGRHRPLTGAREGCGEIGVHHFHGLTPGSPATAAGIRRAARWCRC